MKRSGPPARRVPLARGVPLEQAAVPLQRSAPMPRNGRKRRTPRRTSTARDLREVTMERDGGCVKCGATTIRLETHHRRRKGIGGSRLLDIPANLITLCGWGNHTGDHGWVHRWPAQAELLGLVIPDGPDPLAATLTVPVRYPDGGWWLLDAAGDRRQIA